jgi:signal peptidase II
LAALAAAVIGLDQVTKTIVAATLSEGESIRLIGDVLRLSHFRNSGAAFGLLRGFGGVFALAALVGVIAFIGVIVRRPPPWIGVAAALVAAGALGNLLDRLFRGPVGRGTVVDFVDFRFWPAFNVADASISIGALLLIAATWRERGEDRGS